MGLNAQPYYAGAALEATTALRVLSSDVYKKFLRCPAPKVLVLVLGSLYKAKNWSAQVLKQFLQFAVFKVGRQTCSGLEESPLFYLERNASRSFIKPNFAVCSFS